MVCKTSTYCAFWCINHIPVNTSSEARSIIKHQPETAHWQRGLCLFDLKRDAGS